MMDRVVMKIFLALALFGLAVNAIGLVLFVAGFIRLIM